MFPLSDSSDKKNKMFFSKAPWNSSVSVEMTRWVCISKMIWIFDWTGSIFLFKLPSASVAVSQFQNPGNDIAEARLRNIIEL